MLKSIIYSIILTPIIKYQSMWKKGFIFRLKYMCQKHFCLPSTVSNDWRHHIQWCCTTSLRQGRPTGSWNFWKNSKNEEEGPFKIACNRVIYVSTVMLMYKMAKLSLKGVKYLLNAKPYGKSKWSCKTRACLRFLRIFTNILELWNYEYATAV